MAEAQEKNIAIPLNLNDDVQILTFCLVQRWAWAWSLGQRELSLPERMGAGFQTGFNSHLPGMQGKKLS